MGNRSAHFSGLSAGERPVSETPLIIWMEQHEVSCFALAQRCGVTPSAMSHWMRGQAIPPLVVAFKIERETRGKVPVSSWLGTELGQALWNSSTTDWRRKKAQRAQEMRDNQPKRRRKHGSYYGTQKQGKRITTHGGNRFPHNQHQKRRFKERLAAVTAEPAPAAEE